MELRINPLRREVKELLLKGMPYAEVRNRTGATAQMVANVALELENRGHSVTKKSESDLLKTRVNSMRKGAVADILNELDTETTLELYGLSTRSWADAIAKKLKQKGEFE